MGIVLDSIKDFFGNYMLMSAVVAWLSAQIIKIFTGAFQNRKMSLKTLLFSSGGMPSSHAAAVVARADSVHDGRHQTAREHREPDQHTDGAQRIGRSTHRSTGVIHRQRAQYDQSEK